MNRYDGAIKAEHGTGRNMAPFVQTEWGSEGYEIMRRLKQLCDPQNLLNPGVVINPDPKAHLSDLKHLPSVEPEVDKCIECGFCEPKCPSRELTLTPRQRIVVRREMARIQQNGNSDRELYAALDREFPYMALDTCAADGLCATACPVSIDTGSLVKRFRRIRHTEREQAWSVRMAKDFAQTEFGLRWALRLGHRGAGGDRHESDGGHHAHAAQTARRYRSLWTDDIPHAAASGPVHAKGWRGGSLLPELRLAHDGSAAHGDERSLADGGMVAVAERAGHPVYIPSDVKGTCCGTPFSSKGFDRAHKIVANEAIEKFWRWTEQGRLPVVVDTSPCTYGFLNSRPYSDAREPGTFRYIENRRCDRVRRGAGSARS